MKSIRSLLKTGCPTTLILLFLSVAVTLARDPQLRVLDLPPEIPSPPAVTQKFTNEDTLYLLGGPDRGDGNFQNDNQPHLPSSDGWVPFGEFDNDAYWHLDSFNAELLDESIPGNQAMWCGKYFLPCDTEPENPGYGNNVHTALEWAQPVPDAQAATQVTVTARLNHDTEPSYDFLYLEVHQADGWTPILTFDYNNKVSDVFVPVDINESFTVQPADYSGDEEDEVQLRWRFRSDGGFSDEDCLWPTDGAAQVDNITVTFDQGEGPFTVTEDDFEPGSGVNWTANNLMDSLARSWPGLADAGVCNKNATPKLAFIDDGSADFSSGTMGTYWTYGPGGYTVYCPHDFTPYTDRFLSPVIDLPADLSDYDGAKLEFDIYVHGTALGTLNFVWWIRTSSDGGNIWSGWDNFGFVYEQHGPEYKRESFDVTSLVDPAADKLQLSLGVMNIPTFTGCDFVTPAPYYDNVSFKLFKRSGPEVYLWRGGVNGLAGGGFPASGELDLADPASHSVRIDSRFEDEIRVKVAYQRQGARPAGAPELHWQLKRNPIYDPYRLPSPPNPVLGDSLGLHHPADGRGGAIYAFDLPDTGFFFPGDVLHYYVRAADDLGGDMGVAMLPADTTGFSIFPGDEGYVAGLYPLDFEVRALPSLRDFITGEQPRTLVWLHTFPLEETDEWLTALANLGYQHSVDIDFFKSPSLARPNLTAAQMVGYDVLLYSNGKNVSSSLSEDERNHLVDWFAQGDKQAMFTGDNFVSKLGGFSYTFRTQYLGVDIEPYTAGSNVRPRIDDQERPFVVPVAGNPVGLNTEFYANGGCYYNLFDAITPHGTGQRVLDFTAPGGGPGGYEPAAGIYNNRTEDGSRIITLPYGFAFIETASGRQGGSLASRTRILQEVMTFFGAPGSGPPTNLPDGGGFTVRCYPNPFNPRAQIEYDLPQRGHVSVKIYNLRGELVRTLLDETVAAGPDRLVWDGSDAQEQQVSAGVYFFEITGPGVREVRKMALIR